MVDHKDAKVLLRLRELKLKARLNTLYATKLDALAARMYVDDADIVRGAASEPRHRERPGTRDDALDCSLARMMPVL